MSVYKKAFDTGFGLGMAISCGLIARDRVDILRAADANGALTTLLAELAAEWASRDAVRKADDAQIERSFDELLDVIVATCPRRGVQ